MRRILLWLFCLATVDAQAVTITYAGDYGANANTRAVLARVAKQQPDLHLALGDLSYKEADENAWCAMVKSAVTQSVLMVAGNHETMEHPDADLAKIAQCLPYAYHVPAVGEYPVQYYVDVPLARLIVIAPDITLADGRSFHYAPGSDEMNWLSKAIAEARVKATPYIIVAMHKVCLTTEEKSCEIGETLANALIEKKVDLVLAGHVHAYERTFPLTCLEVGREKAACIVRKKSDYLQTVGTTFITVGTGGKTLRKLNAKDAEKAYFAKRLGAKEGHYGIGALTLAEDRLTHRFLDAASGTVLDEVVIRRR